MNEKVAAEVLPPKAGKEPALWFENFDFNGNDTLYWTLY